MAGFEDLQVWQRAVDLSAAIYQGTGGLKDFRFRDQITRAGLSIPSNIPEGMERSTPSDKIRFLDYARASCAEVRTQALVGMKAGLLDGEPGNMWIQETRELSAMIQGLMRSIRALSASTD